MSNQQPNDVSPEHNPSGENAGESSAEQLSEETFYPTRAQGTASRVYEPMRPKVRRRITFYLTITAAAFVIVPFLFWRGTWFGRALPDAELGKYLTDKDQPRHVQHALVQIGERIEKGDTKVKQWYPAVAALTSSSVQELRVTLAWVLGTDPQADEFHNALLVLLRDQDMLVRRNAALSLVRFQDDSGREEILAMFRPTTIRASAAGKVEYRAQLESGVDDGTVVAKIERGPDDNVNVPTPVPGKVLEIKIPDGSAVEEGDELMVLAPGELHVWEALRALVVIGRPEDIELLTQFERFGAADLPAQYRRQTQVAIAEIRRRADAAPQLVSPLRTQP